MPRGIRVKQRNVGNIARFVGSAPSGPGDSGREEHTAVLPLPASLGTIEHTPADGRLRAPALHAPFHVILVEPEIPPNTGNIARLCAATRCPLHLVGRLGFSIDEHAVRRAGLDYWHLVDLRTHPDLESAERDAASAHPDGRTWLFSAKARKSYLDATFRRGDALVFGKESVGLAEQLLQTRREHVIGIPTLGAVRSLNLANAVAIAIYEALRQVGALVVDERAR